MKKGTRNKVLITAVVAILGMTFLVYSVLANSGDDKWADEVMSDQQAWIGKKVRVLGYVEAGTLKKQIVNQQAIATFVIEKNGKRIPVEVAGEVPDTLTDHAETSALGHLEDRHGQLVFVATDVSAKCPSKYEGADSNRSLAVKPNYQ
jgi:cytochrome c-type biogenesis protein CcmE